MLQTITDNKSGEITCPICGNKTVQNKILISENNLQFLCEHSSNSTLDEALTLLRILVERVPGMVLDVSSKKALEEYLREIQEQIARTVVNPIALLTDHANRLVEQLSELTEDVPSTVKSEFKEINRALTEKMESIEKNAAGAPLTILNGAINPLMQKLDRLTEVLPKNLKEEFGEELGKLKDALAEIKSHVEKSNGAIGDEVRELGNNINSLINKPTERGRFGEAVLTRTWSAEFAQDIVDEKGGPGEPDMVVTPFLEMNGGDFGQRISIERKAGSQRYCGRHVEEASRHGRKNGAKQILLVYDNEANLPEEMRPMKIMFRSQERLIIAVACLDPRSWVTAREILEVFQILNPLEVSELRNEINLVELDKSISDIQAVNITLDKLRKSNNTMARCCETTRNCIQELEESIFAYQNRLKQALDKRNKLKS